MQSLYEAELGPVMVQGEPLTTGMSEVATFDEAALVAVLRADQAGETTFLEFATAAWRAGVLNYVVDLEDRTCTYFGLGGVVCRALPSGPRTSLIRQTSPHPRACGWGDVPVGVADGT